MANDNTNVVFPVSKMVTINEVTDLKSLLHKVLFIGRGGRIRTYALLLKPAALARLSYAQGILSPLRLPIPPSRRISSAYLYPYYSVNCATFP